MNAPEIHYVPPVTRHGYVTQDPRWFVSVAGWGRRFNSRDAALTHYDTLTGGTMRNPACCLGPNARCDLGCPASGYRPWARLRSLVAWAKGWSR